MKPKNIDFKRIAYHLLFWTVLSVFYDSIISLVYDKPFLKIFVHDLMFFFPSDILGVYFTIYFLIPKFLLKRKYISFTVFFFVFFIFLMLAVTMPLQYLGFVLSYNGSAENIPTFIEYTEKKILISLTLKLMIIGIATTIKLAKVWFVSQKRQQNLMNEKLEIKLQLKDAELKYLKTQINPHFLFNALNNLYGLTLEKSSKAPDVVLKISSILDYLLYECNVTETDISKEIQNIKDYIDLQRLRYDDKADITFDVEGETSDVSIAPLLILPLVENAFKHGLDKNLGKGFTKITITVSEDEILYLKIVNSLNGEKNHKGEGIGLKNLKRRLDLQYPGKYELKTTPEEKTFISELKIDLSK